MTGTRGFQVVGAGGIGVALAWALANAGRRVTLVEADPAKVEAARRDGVAVAGRPPARVDAVPFADWSPRPGEPVLLCTKTYDNAAVLDRVTDARRLVPVQNGYDERLEAMFHPSEGIASFVSECERGRPMTRITRRGALHLGGRGGGTDGLGELAAALRTVGLFRVVLVPDVRPYKAAKLMYNAAVSPLAAAAGVDNGELLADPLARRLFFGLLRENYAVLRGAEVPLARVGPFHPDTVNRVLRTPGLARLLAPLFRPGLRGTYCSMAPDLPGRRTEIDAYNGHLVRLAGDRPCPLNRAALAVVRAMERDGSRPDRSMLGRVAALADAPE